MAKLDRVVLKGFKSIKAMELELGSLNVLIGANGSGKSNLISFFKMLNEMMGKRLREFVAASGYAQSLLHLGPKITPQMEGRLEFQADKGRDTYFLRLFHGANDTLVFAEETLEFLPTGRLGGAKQDILGAGHQETLLLEPASKELQTAKALRYFLNRCRVYHFHDTSATARARQSCYKDDNRWLMHDAGNLAALLYAYQEKSELVYRRIVATIQLVMPDFDNFDLQPDRLNPNQLTLNWRKKNSDYLFGPHQISDGTLRAMAIVTLFLQPEEDFPGLIILDEPELGLHPQALEIVAGLIRAAALKTQVIIATQSQSLLEHFEPSEIVVVESNHGCSEFHRLDAGELSDWLADYSIGELWEKNVIGGGPLS
jgi:predicted ATPase